MTYHEHNEIWRLYRREWVIVHTISQAASADHVDYELSRCVFDAACAWVKENLAGRVHDHDVRLEMNTDNGFRVWCHIKVFKDNLKGEFKHVEQAQVHAKTEGYDEYAIVPKNSKSDHDMGKYGVIRL